MPQHVDIKSEEWDLKLIPDLTGKIALVTGANSSDGIGWNIAQQLAFKNAKVYIGARSLEKAEKAIVDILDVSPLIPSVNLVPFVADLANFKQTKEAAEKFIRQEQRLDILVNNAAVLPSPLSLGEYGISTLFATNHLSVFLLTTTLLPLLKKTAAGHPGVRVVTISSVGHTLVPPGSRFDSIEAFNNTFGGTDGVQHNVARYGYSKLANILFAAHLQRKFDAENIQAISLSLHPGAVVTAGAKRFVGENLQLFDGALTALQGAVTPLFAATAPEIWTEKEKYAGQYLMPFGALSPSDVSSDARSIDLAIELWNTSKRVLSELGF